MDLPEFLYGDNTDFSEDIFIIHTQFPRFIINLRNDEVEWLEEFDKEDEEDLQEQMQFYITEAAKFFDREVKRYQDPE